MRILLLTMTLTLGGTVIGAPCKTVELTPPPRIFQELAWSRSGEELLVADLAAGEIGVYALSGRRERTIQRPGPGRLDFSSPNSIMLLPQGYLLGDRNSRRFIVLDDDLEPIRSFDLYEDQTGSEPWQVTLSQRIPVDGGFLAYGQLRRAGGSWKTGVFRMKGESAFEAEFLREYPGAWKARKPYLLSGGYLASIGNRGYFVSFEPDYGLLEIDGRGTRLLKGLPEGFGSLPDFPPSRGRASSPIMYEVLSETKGIAGVEEVGGALYLLLRDISPRGGRRWLMAEYDPVAEETVSFLLLPTTNELIEVSAGSGWVAITEKGRFLPEERFDMGEVILIPTEDLVELRGAGGTLEEPIPLCQE